MLSPANQPQEPASAATALAAERLRKYPPFRGGYETFLR